jgi:hypothetical protein
MKNNKLLILVAYLFLAVLTLGLAEKVSAQWKVPPDIFNLPKDINAGIINLTNWFLGIAGLLSVLFLIWGGINYIFSSGDTQKSEKSKLIIYYAMIGLFVAGLGYSLIKVITTVILKP